MEILGFRITHFRSIIDSGWVEFSRDGVTVLVGQNESGKTSVLQALHCALGGAAITPDDTRINAPNPVVDVRVQVSFDDLDQDELASYQDDGISALKRYLQVLGGKVDLSLTRTAKSGASSLTELSARLADPAAYSQILDAIIPQRPHVPVTTHSVVTENSEIGSDEDAAKGVEEEEEEEEKEELELLTADAVALLIYLALPLATFFSAETGLLPNTVDIDEKGLPTGAGALAAGNYLAIADIDLPSLVKGDGRYRQNILSRANQKLTDDFASFWSQVIGSKSKLTLQCAFEFYGSSVSAKVGKPYLEFWISDGNTQLYPKQRSQGVRWFVSFYLQLRATEKSRSRKLFLLDEPGANLHDKAQEDVLRLIDRLRKEIPIIYSTHSPKMIEYEKLYRIRAVQRDDAQEDSPTVIIDAQHLGAASSDTLSPLLSAMGSDMSQQVAIKKRRNVLLEEISGYYYLKSFWQLLGRRDEVHFIAATGVNKLPVLANMFLGWGLDFAVAVDDDKQGREVFNQLKKDLCGDSDDLAKKLLLKFPGCTAIEEVFSQSDFKKHVLRNPDASLAGTNAEFMKATHLSKPVTALEFMLAVNEQRLGLESFDLATKEKMKAVTQGICDILDLREKESSGPKSKKAG